MRLVKRKSTKRPLIILINIILVAISLLGIVLKLITPLRFELTLQYLGGVLTYFDYGMDIILFIFGVFVEWGLYSYKKWAWKAVFVLYGVYLSGKVFGYILGFMMYDKMLELASMIRYGEIRQLNIPFEWMVITSILALVSNGLITFFILRAHYKVKDHFQN